MSLEFFRRHKIKYKDIPKCWICDKMIDVEDEYRANYNSPHKVRYYCMKCAKDKNIIVTKVVKRLLKNGG